jgi:FkbM family methyltransferase
VIGNPFNWLAVPRAFLTICSPLSFFSALVRGRALPEVIVRTPVGKIRIALRNFESTKTLFSVFCRRDYATPKYPAVVLMDVGANIGITSLYFVSRNRANRAICFEPDRANVDILTRNLLQFADRTEVRVCALATSAGTTTFYRAEDGKYSSLIQSERACLPDPVECRVFSEALRAVISEATIPIVVKLDVEGLEPDLVRSVEWEHFPRVHRLVCEGTECGRLISRPHRRQVRSGYVEDMCFSDFKRPIALLGPRR